MSQTVGEGGSRVNLINPYKVQILIWLRFMAHFKHDIDPQLS